MKNQRIRRPSPALVIAVIALICALTGTAWAALGKNSVGSKQLKKNAVTSAKLKKESVTAAKIKKATITGKQINLAKLGTVPSAQLANTIPPAEPTHFVGAPGEPPFEQAVNVGVPESTPVRFNNVGFYKDQEGIVHLEGAAKTGKGTSGVASIFTLPPGYRPAAGTVLIVPAAGLGGTEASLGLIGGTNTLIPGLDLSGKVVGSEERPIISLDGFSFRPGS